MEWIAFSLLVLGTIYFAIQYRAFRRGLSFTLLGIVALAAVGGIVAYIQNHQQEQRRQVAKTLIRSDQIEIVEATLSIGILSEMKAVVTNNSPYQLAELAVRVTVMDCPAKNLFDDLIPSRSLGTEPVKKGDQLQGKPTSKCAAVGQYVAREYGLDIPSGQKRAFRGYVRFDSLPPLRPYEWS